MPELAYINGNILPIEDATVSIEDRGYQFGDAVYEVISARNGEMFREDEHLARLRNSMNQLKFPDISVGKIKKEMTNFFEKAGLKRAAIYIQISRGSGPRDHVIPEPDKTKPIVIMTIRNVKDMPEEKRSKGIAAITVHDIRWKRCDIKTVQLLGNTLAKRQALDSGAFDAIFVSSGGIVREATSSNVFIVKNQEIVTHPATSRILNGITRQEIIAICKKEKIPLTERFYTKDELFKADEVFLTGTITEVLPVVSIDNRKIGNGKAEEIAGRLYGSILSVMP